MTPDDSLVLRVAGIADAENLARLRYQWRVDESGERGLDRRSFEDALRSWMDDHRSSHVPFLALRSTTPVGMAWLALVDRVPGPKHFVRRSAYVQSVFVLPPERSLGIGTRLMRFVLDHARGLGLDYVAVHPSERSFSLYRRVGFTDTDRLLELRP
ncbi:MAG TPA: GNAT family N-acetyltransferase [Acidimicrobiales bacterium]|nr:GNAT family N-acetyltransferase [Acidimicrobiales bacterium]